MQPSYGPVAISPDSKRQASLVPPAQFSVLPPTQNIPTTSATSPARPRTAMLRPMATTNTPAPATTTIVSGGLRVTPLANHGVVSPGEHDATSPMTGGRAFPTTVDKSDKVSPPHSPVRARPRRSRGGQGQCDECGCWMKLENFETHVEQKCRKLVSNNAIDWRTLADQLWQTKKSDEAMGTQWAREAE